MTPELLCEWFNDNFLLDTDPDEDDYVLATVVKLVPERRFWFAADDQGDIHCHAGNAWQPKGYKLKRKAKIDLQVGDKLLVLPVEGKQGTKAFKWVTLGDVAKAYEDTSDVDYNN